MALFPGAGQGGNLDIDSEVNSLRSQGLTDDQILSELKAKGAKEQLVISSISRLGSSGPPGMGDSGPQEMPEMPSMPPSGGFGGGMNMPAPNSAAPSHGAGGSDSPQDLYDRIEEITEEMIDEKWDDLIKEVRKIVEWKNSVETKMQKMEGDLGKLKEDFKVLHQGVLGKVEEYDKRMQEVGTELKAVGKVFKDVVPVFTENVKELRSITQGMRPEKKE